MAGKKRILFIVEAMGGGVFTYIVDLANELVNTYDMYIAYAIRKQTPPDYKEYFDKRIKLIKINSFCRSINPTSDIKAFFEIKKIAKEIKPDLIHLHSSKAGALGRFAFSGKRIPLFYTPHGYSFLMQDHNAIKRFIYKSVETICSKRNCTTISCSEGENLETLKLTSKSKFVDNGINIQSLQNLIKTIQPERNHTFTVFTLGRICYQKNPVLFNKIAEAMPNINFLWIGDGEMREELKSPNIEITGWLNRNNALTKSLSADVFILTSLWEGLPISLLEAMFMRKPCVVNDVIGNHDVIHNGINGFVCKNVSDFVSAISEIQTGSCVHLVETAYEDIIKKYNTKAMAAKYSAIYKKAIISQRVS